MLQSSVTGCIIGEDELCAAGTWQEYCVAPVDRVYAVPDSLSNHLAAIFWSNPVSITLCKIICTSRQ